jgi:DNA-binding HxlR family transcriptional regulator
MKTKPVDLYFKILNIIFKDKASVNEIYKQTGLSYKPKFTNALKELEKEKIVRREKDPRHRQREFILLTNLGFELSEFKKRLDDYISSYKKLYEIENNLEDTNNLKDQSRIRNILRHRGWKEEEIFWFKDTYEGIKEITWYGDFDLFEGFIYRYILLLSNFKLGEISKLMINSLLTEVTNFKIKNIYDTIKDSSEKVENYNVILDQHLGNISEFNYAFPKLLQDEVKNHILIRLYLLRPPTDLISKKFKDKQIIIETYKKDASEETKKGNLSNPAIRSKCLIDAYKEYLKIETI